jgi:hypothetical protein
VRQDGGQTAQGCNAVRSEGHAGVGLGEKQLLEGTAATGEVEHIAGIGQVSRDEKKDLVGEVSEHCGGQSRCRD